MPSPIRQIFAFSGVLDSAAGKGSFALVEHALSLAARAGPDHSRPDHSRLDHGGLDHSRPGYSAPDGHQPTRVCDILMAVWRAHRLPRILRRCWRAGVVLAGASAGRLCWHVGGPADSYRDSLDPFTGGLGLVPYSNGVHDDFPGQPRRTVCRALIAQRVLPGGYATEDGIGPHYLGTALHEAVSIRPGKRAWRVDPAPGDDGYTEEPIEPRPI